MTIEIETKQYAKYETVLPGGNTISHEDGLAVVRDAEGFLLGMGTDKKSVIRAVYDVSQGREIIKQLNEYVIYEDKGGDLK